MSIGTEKQTVGDYIRSLSDEKLAEYIIKIVEGAFKEVCVMWGVKFYDEKYDEENAVKQFVDYLRMDVNEIGKR